MELQRPLLDNKRILLVEDDNRIVDFMQRGLEAEGMTLDVVSAKTPALHLAESRRYNTIILDIYLGDDDGLDVCRNIRQRLIDTPVLVMTAKDSMELREASVKAGANAYLPKPFSFDDLLSTLEKMLQAYLTVHKTVPMGLPAQVRT
ncbi:MAG: response regulator [Nitrospirae bacterium]|nr:response regulator [Nitrospirota bacterium]